MSISLACPSKEKQTLSAEKERLTHQARTTAVRVADLQRSLEVYKSGHAQLTERLHAAEDGDKTRADRVRAATA